MVSALACHATYRSDISGVTMSRPSCRCDLSQRCIGTDASMREPRPRALGLGVRCRPRRTLVRGSACRRVRPDLAAPMPPSASRRADVRVAKRRAARPAPSSASAEAAGASRSRAQAAAAARSLKWLLIVGLVGTLLLAGGLLLRYKTTDIPDPNKDFQTQTSFVYYADGKTELGQFATQNRESIPLDEMPQTMQDAVVAAEDRTFWTNKRHRPQGHPPGGVQQRPRQRHPGRVDDHPAVRQDPLPDPGALLQAQGQGGVPVAEAPAAAEQAADPRGLPQHHLLRPRRLRHPGGREGVLRQPTPRTSPCEQAAVLASVLNNPTHFDPANGKATREALLKERYHYVLDGMADDGHHHRRPRPSRPPKQLPKFPKIEAEQPVRRPEGPHARRWSSSELHAARLHRRGDRRRRPAGHHHVHARRRWTAAEQGVLEAAARGLQRQGAARRGRHRRAGHRRAARLLRRPGLPRLPDQLGRRRRHGRLDVQAVRAGRRRSTTASRSRTPSTATRRYDVPRRPRRSTTRATATGNDYGSAVTLITAHSRSRSTPRSST